MTDSHKRKIGVRIPSAIPSSLERRERLIRSLTKSPLSHIQTPFNIVAKSIEPFLSNIDSHFRKQQIVPHSFVESPIARIIKQIKAPYELSRTILELPSSVLISSLIDSDALTHNALLAQSLIGQVTLHLSQASSDPTFERFQNITTSLEKLFDEKIRRNSPNIISFDAFLQILIATIFFLSTVYLANETDKSIQELNDKVDKILPKIETLSPKEDTSANRILYTCKSHSNVRTEPSSKSLVVDILYPNQIVSFIQEKKNWMYVEYFDYVEDLPKMGWVYKGNLKRIEN